MARERILIVEDGRDSARYLVPFLTKKGYMAVNVSSGRDAIKSVKEAGFGAAIVDLNLPGLSGMQVAKKIASSSPETGVILITERPTLECAMEGLRLGAVDLLSKPLDEVKLLDAIRSSSKRKRNGSHNGEQDFCHLSKVNNAALNPYRLDFLFYLILDVAEKLLGVKTAFFMLLDEPTRSLSVKAAKGMSEDAIRDLRVKVGEGIAGWVAKSGKTLMEPDVACDKRLQGSPENAYEIYKGQSVLSIPIKIKERTVGVVSATREPSKGVFTERDKEILDILTLYASQALEKNELYKEIDYVLARLQSIQVKYGHYEGR
ncbi:MAG: response regulator [Candidatus Omnitrophota bacterium]